MLSERTFFLLSIIPEDGLPEDQLPDISSYSEYLDLQSRGFVRISTLIPPGKEPECMCGMRIVYITSAGRDALFEKQWSEHKVVEEIARKQADDEARATERSEDKRLDFIYFISGLVFGWLLGLITPVDVWLWLRRSAEHIWSMLH